MWAPEILATIARYSAPREKAALALLSKHSYRASKDYSHLWWSTDHSVVVHDLTAFVAWLQHNEGALVDYVRELVVRLSHTCLSPSPEFDAVVGFSALASDMFSHVDTLLLDSYDNNFFRFERFRRLRELHLHVPMGVCRMCPRLFPPSLKVLHISGIYSNTGKTYLDLRAPPTLEELGLHTVQLRPDTFMRSISTLRRLELHDTGLDGLTHSDIMAMADVWSALALEEFRMIDSCFNPPAYPPTLRCLHIDSPCEYDIDARVEDNIIIRNYEMFWRSVCPVLPYLRCFHLVCTPNGIMCSPCVTYAPGGKFMINDVACPDLAFTCDTSVVE